MRLTVKSIQKYKDHQEEITDSMDDAQLQDDQECIVIFNKEDQMKFNMIQQEAIITRNHQVLVIKINEKKSNQYETPYGKIVLDTYGEQMEVTKNPFHVFLRYRLFFPSVEEYENVVEITEG